MRVPEPTGRSTRAGRAEIEPEPRATLAVSESLRAEWLRLVAGLRSAVQAAVVLDAPPGRLRELADRAAGLSRDLSVHARGRSIPLSHGLAAAPGARDLEGLLPFSPVMGCYNPIAPPLSLSLEGDRVVGRVRFGSAFQGAEGLVHGGSLAACFDEVLAMATIAKGMPGPIASLSVHYRRPTPLRRELRLEGWVDRVQRRKVHARATCRVDGDLVAEAQGLFVRPASAPHWSRLRRDG